MSDESKDSVAFKIMLEERDRLRAEVDLLQAELVRRDQAHEAVRGQIQGLRYSTIRVPTMALVAFGRTTEAYKHLSHLLAEEIIKANAGTLRPEGNGPLRQYQFSLHYNVPD